MSNTNSSTIEIRQSTSYPKTQPCGWGLLENYDVFANQERQQFNLWYVYTVLVHKKSSGRYPYSYRYWLSMSEAALISYFIMFLRTIPPHLTALLKDWKGKVRYMYIVDASLKKRPPVRLWLSVHSKDSSFTT